MTNDPRIADYDAAPSAWLRFDKAAFGLIYGAIMVLSILMAMGAHPVAPFDTAVILFGSVIAITLAKAFAELMSHALDTGEQISRTAWRASWHHSSPTLAVANLPTLFFCAAGLDWMAVQTAVLLSQVLCIGLLAVLGARVGWVIDRSIGSAVLGAVFSGTIGVFLAFLKFLIH